MNLASLPCLALRSLVAKKGSYSYSLFVILYSKRGYRLPATGYRRCEVCGVRFRECKSFADHEPNKCEAFNERPHKVLVDFQDLSSVKFPLFDPP